tara:strand:- start:320 stop:793 length:474 start_codon:yes stop_codon:yes gene_type:complete
MVHIYYYLNETGIARNAEICEFVADQIQRHLDLKPVLKLTGWTTKYPVWSGVDTGELYDDKDGLNTRYQLAQKFPHIELGGINGSNAISVRKITDWMDGGEKEATIDALNALISDWLVENKYTSKGEPKVGETSKIHCLQEFIENAQNAGATSVHIS